MFVEARESGRDEVAGYFDVNFAPREGRAYTFMWPDGTRKAFALKRLDALPEGAEAPPAAFDIAIREVLVRGADR